VRPDEYLIVKNGVLNDLRLSGSGTLAGFIHFPASTDMAVANPTLPSLSTEMMRRALLIAIQTVTEALPAAGAEPLVLADRA